MQEHDPNGFVTAVESFGLRMRARILSVIVASLALAALLVHLFVPFANYEIADQMGVEPGSGTWTLSDMKEMREGDHVMAPGAAFGYLLGALIVLNVGAITFLIGQFMPGTVGAFTRLATGTITAIGAAMTMHGQGLWAGRMTGSLIHGLGWDAPPARYKDLMAEYSPADIVSLFYPISPLIVLALATAITILLGRVWLARVTDPRHQPLARRHARVALVATISFIAILALPWVVQVMDHGLTELNPDDQDPFFWTAYDVLYLRELTFQEAFEVGEAGLIAFEGLSIALKALMAAAMIGVVAPLMSIGGKAIEGEGETVFGRLVENIGLIALLTFATTILVSFLGAFVLHDSEFYPSLTTTLPLLQWIAAVAGLIIAGKTARDVLQDETDLVADDFPEPVIYD